MKHQRSHNSLTNDLPKSKRTEHYFCLIVENHKFKNVLQAVTSISLRCVCLRSCCCVFVTQEDTRLCCALLCFLPPCLGLSSRSLSRPARAPISDQLLLSCVCLSSSSPVLCLYSQTSAQKRHSP